MKTYFLLNHQSLIIEKVEHSNLIVDDWFTFDSFEKANKLRNYLDCGIRIN